MRSKTKALLVAAVAGLLLWGGAAPGDRSLAQQGPGATLDAIVTPLLQYQGRLSDPRTGQPLSGAYTMSFHLYDSASSARPLWSETQQVTAQGGAFSAVLGSSAGLSPSLFRGQTLWLGVAVGSDAEATPRQQIFPVAYALTLMPGAAVESSGGPALQVGHTSGGEALRVQGDLNVSGSLVGGSHSHQGLLLKTTVLNVSCTGLSSFASGWTKLVDVGTFTKGSASSSLEITFNGRISARTITGTGVVFQLRVDDQASTAGWAGANLLAADAGEEGAPVSITGIFTGRAAGAHTVSLWVAGAYGGGTSAFVDRGCWSTDHVVVREIG